MVGNGYDNNINTSSAIPRVRSGEGRMYVKLTFTFWVEVERLFSIDPRLKGNNQHA